MLTRWDGFTRFLDDGRVCLTNNAAERALRGICLGRKAWLFCGSDRGGQRAAMMYSFITTTKIASTRRPGLPMCSTALLNIQRIGSTNCYLGIGSQ
jgi:Transposase IS66 family